jgi:CheY-like chemotaxis protein
MGKRLLVVDSDRRFIQDHKSQLESAFEVDFLYSTDGAITRLESGEYGGILLCVETSENKGYALCSAIRRAPMFTDLKIALISAKASEEEYARHRGTKGKADLYLHKPLNSTALIPALAELVPLREDDPDNPLGDLAGADLGDEWLESLRTELETEPPPPRTIAPAPGWAMEPVAPPARNPGEIELLEWRVKDLEIKLLAQHEELESRTAEIQDLHARNAAVTRNLDEFQQKGEGEERLKGDLQDALDEQKRLVDQLEEARDEQKRLVDHLEEVQTLLTEKNQQNAELMETHQLLQAQLEEAWEEGRGAKALEGSLAEAREALRVHEAQNAQAEQHRSELVMEMESARAEAAVKQARVLELEAGQGRAEELERELYAVREKAAFQDLTIRNLTEERSGLQGELARRDEAMAAQAGELLSLQEKLAAQEAAARDLRAEQERTGADYQARLDAAEASGENQRREFLAAIEERDGNMGRLTAELEAGRAQLAQLEAEKAGLAARLQAADGRLDAVTGLLADVEGKARQALDLARA